MIYWIGNSENWDKPLHPRAGNMVDSYAFPLVEETVLETAFSPLYVGYGRLSQQAAINCTSRFALRSALNVDDVSRALNPRWLAHHDFGDGLVVKAPASCQNQGIGFALPNEYSHRLLAYAREADMALSSHLEKIKAGTGVVEQYIPGPQYEADGIVIDGKAILLGWSQQEGENGKIVQYIRLPLQGDFGFEAPAEVIETAVKALGLDNCPFCFEMKRTNDGWKIIDAHARLGEDRRLWANQADLFDRIDKIIQSPQ